MIHAREDYNKRIQDSEGIIPTDEPVFLLRGQDVTAPLVVEFWADRAEKAGALPNIVAAARRQAFDMLTWQRLHLVKVPDMPPQMI